MSKALSTGLHQVLVLASPGVIFSSCGRASLKSQRRHTASPGHQPYDLSSGILYGDQEATAVPFLPPVLVQVTTPFQDSGQRTQQVSQAPMSRDLMSRMLEPSKPLGVSFVCRCCHLPLSPWFLSHSGSGPSCLQLSPQPLTRQLWRWAEAMALCTHSSEQLS